MKKAIRPAIFKWRQTEPERILSAVHGYQRHSLSFRDVEELLGESGLEMNHISIWKGPARWMRGSDVPQQIQSINKLFRVAA